MPAVICPRCAATVSLPDPWSAPGYTCPLCHTPTTLELAIPKLPLLKTSGKVERGEEEEDERPRRRGRPEATRVVHVTSVRCYDCDRAIPEGLSVRRALRSGGFFWPVLLLLLLGPLGLVFLIVGLFLMAPATSKKVSLCERCNEERDRKKAKKQLQAWVWAVGIVLFIVLFFALIISFAP